MPTLTMSNNPSCGQSCIEHRNTLADMPDRRQNPGSVTCVALLRGINVGKAKRIAMADLREIVSGLGHQQVHAQQLGHIPQRNMGGDGHDAQARPGQHHHYLTGAGQARRQELGVTGKAEPRRLGRGFRA